MPVFVKGESDGCNLSQQDTEACSGDALGKNRVTCLYFSVQSTWNTKALLKSLANVSFKG